jgi:membrane protease YdiL (CAAX protease family)
MRILATITRATEGAVTWNGTDIAREPDELRQVLGYLPQDFGVYPQMRTSISRIRSVIMDEVRITSLVFFAFWPLSVLTIVVASRRWPRGRGFADKMLAQWKPALAVALIVLIAWAVTGRGLLNPLILAIFCLCLIGFAVARDIPSFEPLAVTQAVVRRDHPLRSVVLLLIIALLLGVIGIVLGAVGIDVIRQIVGETYSAEQALGEFPFTKVQAFFYFLAGAGIVEEAIFRLVALSLIWRWTRRRRLAILLSAILFAIYHLTPLDGMYRTFWEFPISQLISTTLIGLVWGYAYVKRGFETAVLAHTLSDWLPVLLFM